MPTRIHPLLPGLRWNEAPRPAGCIATMHLRRGNPAEYRRAGRTRTPPESRGQRLPGARPRHASADEDEAILGRCGEGHRRMAVDSERRSAAQGRKTLAESGKRRRIRCGATWETGGAQPSASGAGAARRGRLHVLHVTTPRNWLFSPARATSPRRDHSQHLTPQRRNAMTSGHLRADEIRRSATPRTATPCGGRCAKGLIDVIGSDHAPHTRAEKTRPIPKPRRNAGSEDAVTILLDHVNAGRVSLSALCRFSRAKEQHEFMASGQGPDCRGF